MKAKAKAIFPDERPTVPTIVDGSLLEGGGQVLRNAVSYGAVLSKSVEVRNIRSNRSKPGMRAQHLTGIRLAAKICGGRLTGDEIGSRTVRYDPPSVGRPGGAEETIVGDTGTAGSICLLLQTALPCALLDARLLSSREIHLELRGGTNAAMAPQIDYLAEVFLPVAVPLFDLPNIKLTVIRRGYYPRGGGIVRVAISPFEPGRRLRPISLTKRGRVVDVRIRSFHAGNVPRYVAQKMADAAIRRMRNESSKGLIPKELRPRVEVVTEASAVASGSGILIVARTNTGNFLAGSALGGPIAKADNTGMEAAEELLRTLEDGGCVDEWLQDQLVLFMALAEGTSEILTGGLTLHTRTAIAVAEQLTGAKFEVERLDSDPDREDITGGDDASYGTIGRIKGRHRIRCSGIGFTRE